MCLQTFLQSLRTTVLTDNWRPVIVGIAVVLVIGFASIVIDILGLLFASGGIGGLVAGFVYGKHWKGTTAIGFRVGVIGAILLVSAGLLVMAGGFWTLQWGPENVGVVDFSEESPGMDTGDPGLEESGPNESTSENSSVRELSTETSMTFLVLFSLVLIPASALLAMLGCAVGTNVRRAVVPDEYNPPLF
ncbi:hypothetical protein HLRTI_002878 [Halorhabdus tiamatea SARL4B]|uniref:Uncharacterized protein n=2 Tax=Halorhabdus tiamatea SARL4B TaxID=1033806 RepID=U2F497_9EURY|nr:hypothetical protein [Halorhabdus tiamatea]ERJ05155.1 hypothetical protein HLRTI_002878 [Halorhabdus tiamatea SARL4B]